MRERAPPKARSNMENMESMTLSPMIEEHESQQDGCVNEQETTNDLTTVTLPTDWILQKKDKLIFSKMVESPNCPISTFNAERQIIVNPSGITQIVIRGKSISSSESSCTDVDSLTTLISKVESMQICHGVKNHFMFKTYPGTYRCGSSIFSDTCPQFVAENLLCPDCELLKHTLAIAANKELRNRRKLRITPSTPDPIRLLKKRNQQSLQRVRRLQKRNIGLKDRLGMLQEKFKNAEVNSLHDVIEKSEGLPQQFKLALKTAVSLQKAKSPNGRRYPGDWLLQALLLRITSPKAYRHLRKEGILPLPHPAHLTRMLKGLKCEFGFNDFILNHLKQEFGNRPRKDRQVFLSFDEMKVKEAIDFSKAKMKFTGFIDYGEFSAHYQPRVGTKVEADHALVFMVRSLNSKLTQPIGTFATRGAAPGTILAKMIISAIVRLEESGLEVVGVVSDGASNNKSAWKALGVCGEYGSVQNKIQNPADFSRNVHFLCDVPHIVKCIRNHFQKQGVCMYNGKMINWGVYQAVYDMDKTKQIRLAPKLTPQHLNPGPFHKMSVAKAVQVFSNTVANAIGFHRDYQKNVYFKHSEGTEAFTRAINSLFDVLNARIPTEGLKPGCSKSKIIEEFLRSLSPLDTFASELTMASLRVTLQSSLDLISYLCNDVGFKYVLTAKFNQDCLEKFFGLIRSFGGDNCHPTIATFSHLFRLLSIYNPTSRLIKGNVKADEEVHVNAVSYIDMLKAERVQHDIAMDIYKQDLERLISAHMITVTDDNPEEGMEHDHTYGIPSSAQSIAHYLSGYIAFKGARFTDCEACLKGLTDDDFRPPESNLTNYRNNGGLKFPSKPLFKLVSKSLEPPLSSINAKTASSSNFITELIDQLEIDCTDLGCSPDHSEDLACKITLFYITIRMYFFSKIHNREVLSSTTKSQEKAKEGKLK